MKKSKVDPSSNSSIQNKWKAEDWQFTNNNKKGGTMLVQKSKLKKFVNKHGLKMSRDPQLIAAVNTVFESTLEGMIERATDSGVKTLKSEHAITSEAQEENVADKLKDALVSIFRESRNAPIA